ncbi:MULTISPECIES: type II toxin-antitoxin system VapC family toxin [unclassified Inquilinus]|uniref:type II toxin-antitoxin system VapC family toxin n=1 Tax=unclassified Inquilinus TaxID=2645927 RepID=UPI003F8F6DE1
MTTTVIDASAILALLLNEPGAQKVAAVLADSVVTTVNLSEVVSYYARSRADKAGIRQMLDALPCERIPFDEDLAYATGLLLPLTRAAGLSLGDRACLALAKRLGVPAVTADRPWQDIAGAVGVTIDLIR